MITFGTLYIVATPIGNLKDITLRAIEILKDVDFILAEDTRKTIKLLNFYKIKNKLISYRDENHERILPQILHHLQIGKSLALVSDSGTPLISDPGFKLVQKLRTLNFNIISIPGPSAITASLSISGLPTDKFIFLGFLPKGINKREKILSSLKNIDTTIVIHESPYRVKKLLNQIGKIYGERIIFIGNDLTKKFEQVWYGKLTEVIKIIEKVNLRGEFIILIAKKEFSN